MGPGLDLEVGKGAWTRESGRLTGLDCGNGGTGSGWMKRLDVFQG